MKDLLENVTEMLLLLSTTMPTQEHWANCKEILQGLLSHCRGRMRRTQSRPEWLEPKLNGVFRLHDDIENVLSRPNYENKQHQMPSTAE